MQLRGTKPTKKNVGKLRQGQFLTTFGCGAIVDLPRESVIIAGTDYWRHHDKPRYHLYEPNLQQFLGVDYFVRPPESVDKAGQQTGFGIPAFRFPNWMYCPKCKRLQPAKKFGFVGKPRCEKCKAPLVPSRFVVACEKGHLDDFPYEWWVHGGNCTEKVSELYIEMSGEKSTLDSIIIKCKNKKCTKKEKCSKSMAGSFGPESLKGLKCRGIRPWLQDVDREKCGKTVTTMQRGATNLHFTITASALSIPPWSQKVQIELDENWANLKPLLYNPDLFIPTIEAWKLPKKCGCSAEDIYEEAKRKNDMWKNKEEKSWQDILEGEYKAFLTGSDDEKGEFKTKEVRVPDFMDTYIDQVVLAVRLREVMALRGFKRINPDYDVNDMSSFNMLGKDLKNWLPAIALKGEGIFIRFNQDKLLEWEKSPEIQRRYAHMKEFTRHSMIKGPGITPRYVLLHTFSHLLIRQLTLQCGYSSASIKERIYSTFVGEEKSLDMAGVLIYTATNDSEGSLGGLVREGNSSRLDSTLRQMLETASWCSADPLCIQSNGQGLDALNLAACHSCTLLPETSCEARNCYLDRGALIGTLGNTSLGLLAHLFQERGE